MRTLHTTYRDIDLAASLDFYVALGYEQVGRLDLGDGTTLTMLKFPDDEVVTLELVYRPTDGPVVIGSEFSAGCGSTDLDRSAEFRRPQRRPR